MRTRWRARVASLLALGGVSAATALAVASPPFALELGEERVRGAGFQARAQDQPQERGVDFALPRRHQPVADRPGLRVEWRDSTAVGLPEAGRLIRGVRLPPEGAHFFTWDPVEKRRPNRPQRRWGTDELIRVTLEVIREFADGHPGAARVGIGDLSRPRGGDFGPEYGFIGHATHQNGIDVDVYYPRLDRRERPPRSVEQIDLALAQDLVDLFVAAGAAPIYVGPATGLTGPAGVVAPLVNHDNHLHARIAP
jgi:Penicillin-insensitive murein endopeptidase